MDRFANKELALVCFPYMNLVKDHTVIRGFFSSKCIKGRSAVEIISCHIFEILQTHNVDIKDWQGQA